MSNAYNAPNANVELPLQQDEIEYVGFWARAAASIIDTIWMGLLLIPLVILIYGMAYFDSDKIVQGPADALISYVLPAVIVILFWIYKSATPGKMVVNARILDAKTLQPVSPGRLILRYVAYYISMIPLFLGFMWVGWDKRKQGFHDKIAGTVVVKKK